LLYGMKNFNKVFKIFESNYKLVPLEIYTGNPYKTLIATLLSARSRDDLTVKICEKLFLLAPTIQKLNSLSVEKISELIYPVGFYKTKAKHLKSLANVIITNFSGKVPDTREELVTLPGVGRKTANLVLNRAFGIPAIAVDTHVFRISNLLGWVKTNTPEKTEIALMEVLPKKYWMDINRLFVSIGQQYRSVGKLKKFLDLNGIIHK
jgi:endonuclease-3